MGIADYRGLYARELKVLHAVNDIESVGLRWDMKKATHHNRVLKAKSKTCLKKLYSLVGEHNPNSPKQVLAVLLSNGVKREQLKDQGKLTTGADVIKRVASELPEKNVARQYIETLLTRRSYEKTIGTYLQPLTDRAIANNGIVYCEVNPADSRTGRMASRNPNLQNIPEPIKRQTGKPNPVRSCFICRDGCSNYYFDYAQMELYVFGIYADEPTIVESYEEGEDVHGIMAGYIFGKNYTKRQRGLTKNINFGKIYGLGAKTMSIMYDMTLAEAYDTMREYERVFPSVPRFLAECTDELRYNGHVTDWFGKRYHIPMNQAYKSVNAKIQGSCAQIFKEALLNVHSFMSSNPGRILLPVHDELQTEVETFTDAEEEKAWCKAVQSKMIEIPLFEELGLKLRTSVDRTDTNWAEKKEVEVS